jgi:Fe-S oxidoreductase
VKDSFDPSGLMNPGKIVRSPRMNDRTLLRYKPDYGVKEMATVLDWSAYPGSGGGFQGAVELCNNNGECRKFDSGVMCPSYRVTRNERDLTRGRANTLRLAISGQLGPDALASDEMLETMKLCVSCKACRRECPTGVDMARMKIEVLAAAAKRRGVPLRDRIIAYLPRYAPFAARFAPLMNARDAIPGLAKLAERLTGFTAKRKLPRWTTRPFSASSRVRGEGERDLPRGEVALFADTFNRYFEPENLHAAVEVLERLGYRVHIVEPVGGGRPVCCGRTFLAAGLVEQARHEARRLLAAVAPFVERGVPIIGLEPSCLLTLKDEIPAMLPSPEARRASENAFLFEEFLAREIDAGRLTGPIGRRSAHVLLHGHCHQKSFGAMPAVDRVLSLVEGLTVETVQSSCCGMAGAFGYAAETYEVSMAMGELSLLPAVRRSNADAIIAADGFSCRHQIRDGARRNARHVAVVLRDAMVELGKGV